MKKILLISLILIIQLVIVESDAGRCLYCTDYLNSDQCQGWQQCTWSSSKGCYQNNGRILSTSKASTPLAAQSSSADPSVNRNKSDICQVQARNSSTGICDNYMDGGKISTFVFCALDQDQNCVTVDQKAACTTFQSIGTCKVNNQCFWTNTSSTQGTCNNQKCGDFTNSTACTYIISSYDAEKATACKWVPSNSTSGSTCVNGVASDLSATNCRYYYTYSDANKVCTQCHNVGSHLLYGSIIALLMALVCM